MKTTIDLTDATLKEAKRVAAREGTTLRALIEDGLRRVLAEHRGRRAGFTLRKVTFGGDGVSPEFADQPWAGVRDTIYRERGT